MSPNPKSLLTILGLILATSAALAAMGAMGSDRSATPSVFAPVGDPPLTVSTEVVQDKVLKGSDGRTTVSLNLTAARLPILDGAAVQAADLVIVLDRSGSMEGRKLSDARQAVIRLLDRLSPEDRLALVTYSNGVQVRSALVPVNAANRRQLTAAVRQIHAGGGTNLGGGLERGIDLLVRTPGADRQRKVILLSDGLANQGITDPAALGRMASAAVENRFSISTVGVGLDFNETLMTAIADQGAGHYHFLEDPRTFARVFEDELQATRQVAASDVTVQIPMEPGVRLVGAGGYPIRHDEGAAVIHPGNLLSGGSRTLFLTFQVPTDVEKTIRLGRIRVTCRHQDELITIEAPRPMSVACVADPAAVMASINKASWADQVVQEEFSRLKEEVAADIRDGEKEQAQARIRAYEAKQHAINTVVSSGKVAENLAVDVHELRQQVDETFTGAPAAVAEKKKQVSKSMQYDGYKMRRNK
jgi:Ca-activated chloride channel family protein